MTEIEKESRTLNSERLHQVQKSVGEVQREVNDIKNGVEGMMSYLKRYSSSDMLMDALASHVQTERRLLNALKEQLLLGGHDPNDILDRYSSDVRGSFKNPGRLTTLNMDRLAEEKSFNHWDKCSNSCMFLLHGRTAVTTRDYSWLSPAVFHLIQVYRDQNRSVIFHCCHDQLFMEQDTPSHIVVSSLVYQLLEARPSVVRDQPRYQDLSRKFSDPTWHANQPRIPFAVLGELLDSFPEVYILLDRIDRIKGDADRFLDPLAKLVKESRCRLKVFLVASSNGQTDPQGKMKLDLLESVEEELGPSRFSSLLMNQK